MKLVTFREDDETRIGILRGDLVFDLKSAAPTLPTDMIALIEMGPEALKLAESAADDPRVKSFPVAQVELLSPVLRPRKILAVGLNYHDHINEIRDAGRTVPEVPIIFNKQATAINGPFGDVHLPKVSKALDYEGELAIVIGKTCRHVAKEDARGVVAGYAVAMMSRCATGKSAPRP